MIDKVLFFCIGVMIALIYALVIITVNPPELKDYQIEVKPNKVILYDNGRKVGECKPASIDSLITSDNL